MSRFLTPVLVVAALLGFAPAAHAATAEITITSSSQVSPAAVSIKSGDAVRWVNRDVLPHRVQAASANWSIDSGPIPPGGSFTSPPLKAAGRYAYRGGTLDSYAGTVTVVVASAPSRSSSPTSAAPAPGGTTSKPSQQEPAPAAPKPATTAAPASDLTALPGFNGGLLTASPDAAPTLGPEPAIAPGVDDLFEEPTQITFEQKVSGERALPGVDTPRELGLPVLVALVVMAGVVAGVIRVAVALVPSRGRHRRALVA